MRSHGFGRSRSIPEFRKLDRRIKVIEDQEAALREQERIEAFIDARLRRGNFL